MIFEEGIEDVIFIVMLDIWVYVSKDFSCSFFRIEVGCNINNKVSFILSVLLNIYIVSVDVFKYILDLFIFVVEGYYYGIFLDGLNFCGWEVYIKN